jgi:hypothetical protein
MTAPVDILTVRLVVAGKWDRVLSEWHRAGSWKEIQKAEG